MLGAFERSDDAARRYDRVARFLGRTAQLNFPGDQSPALDPQLILTELRLQLPGSPTSPYVGVSRASYAGLWCAELVISRTSRWLGVWPHQLAAASAVDRARLYYQGPDSALNLAYPEGLPAPADAATLEQESLDARRPARQSTAACCPTATRQRRRAVAPPSTE